MLGVRRRAVVLLSRLACVVAVAGLGGCSGGQPPQEDAGVERVWDGGDLPEELVQPDGGEPDAGTDGGVVATSCSVPCHGSRRNAAPPYDTRDGGARGSVGVGAHQAHLGSSTWHRDGQCADCHVVPATVNAPGHLDPAPAELVWSALSSVGGVTPSWDGGACLTYCHGPTLPGGRLTRPAWTTYDSAQSYCGDCHGVPPPAPHPQNVGRDCSRCHPIAAPGLGFTEPQRHIDGVLDLSSACDTCHGSAGNSAPPVDTEGGTAVSLRGVGAHRSHLGPSSWHQTIECAACHRVPQQVRDVGHLDTPLPAELTWGPLATARGATASWNGTSCQNYCHGSTINNGSNKTPVWTSVGTGQASCGTCHGYPPAAPHPSPAPCHLCHGAVVDASGTFVDPSLHINGRLDVVAPCDSCHGSNGNAAPPSDTQGGTATTLRSVGAHRSHLQGNYVYPAIACSECHVVPTNVGDVGHMDTVLPAELTWGPLATARGATASWNGTTCQNYCHGSTMTGGTRTTVTWTNVGTGEVPCGACHSFPPGPPHPASGSCSDCHPSVLSTSGAFNAALHVNGRVDY